MFQHVVMFKLADSADIDEAVDRLRGMRGKIPALVGIRAGRDCGGGPNAYDIVLITEHSDAAGLTDYAKDPVHQEVLSWLKSRITDRAVVDTSNLT